MALTKTMDPIADGNYTAWNTNGAGASHAARASDDSDATYMDGTGADSPKDSFTINKLYAASVTSVKGRWRGKRNADDDDYFKLFSRISGADSALTANLGSGEMLGAWAWIATAVAIPHPTASWTAADLKTGTSEFGIAANTTDQAVEFSEYEVIVEYVPLSGFIFGAIWGLLPLCGPLGTLVAREWTMVRGLFLPKLKFDDEEWAKQRRILLEHTWPVYV